MLKLQEKTIKSLVNDWILYLTNEQYEIDNLLATLIFMKYINEYDNYTQTITDINVTNNYQLYINNTYKYLEYKTSIDNTVINYKIIKKKEIVNNNIQYLIPK